MGITREKLNVDFIISTGDNFYDDGLINENDPAFDDSFCNIYTAPSLNKQWYHVLGNHDYRGDVLAQLSPVLTERDWRWRCLRSYIVNTVMLSRTKADQVWDSQDLANPLPPASTTKSRRERLPHITPRKTISTSLTQIVQSPVKASSPIINNLIEICNLNIVEDQIYQVGPSDRIEKTNTKMNMCGNNLHTTNDAHVPSQNNSLNQQQRHQYLADIEAEIQLRVNEALERERDKTTQSSCYIHHSRGRLHLRAVRHQVPIVTKRRGAAHSCTCSSN
ncbi:phosphatase [Lithospermum erythrorhizon]|uniref:Phosphatase n=1 Tax=Lithospermum erythrorhizon TaxID=34254 RepID=A0AAV3RTD9_LITER